VLGDKAGARSPRALTGRDPVGPVGRDGIPPAERGRDRHQDLAAAPRHPSAAAREASREEPGHESPGSGTGGDPAARDFSLIEPGTDRARWHPRCVAFAAYIERLAGPGRLPTRGMFEPTAIYRLLPHVWIIDVQRDPLHFAVRLAGTKIVEALGRDVTGLSFAQAFPGVGQAGDHERFVATVAARRGTWRRGRPFFDLGQAWAEVEDVVMPFAADDGATVNMLYGCAVFYGYDRMEW
jgi:hypothetical protein